jgi:hypothetical protein
VFCHEQAWALYCLVMLYQGCGELLKPVRRKQTNNG